MTTRATYLLPAEGVNQPICFYIHSDGYPEGAAYYFYKMHNCKNLRGSLACRFLRANATAEITGKHENHSDTEFQYTINHHNILTVRQRGIFDDNWHLIYQGLWYLFLNQHLEASQHLYAFKCCSFSKRLTLMTIAEAQKYVRAFLYNKPQKHAVNDNIEAVQAQIDDILKRGQNPVSNPSIPAHLATWKEKFFLFSIEVENKIAAWWKQNNRNYFYQHDNYRAAEKFEEDFGLFFDDLIEAWAMGRDIVASGLAFDFRKASNALYIQMVEKYGLKFQALIEKANPACSYEAECHAE
jgi:hypothetical protein